MNIPDEKKALRRELIQRRRNMPDDVKSAADSRIFDRLIPLLEKCSSVFTYVSTEIEVDTRQLMKWCFEHGKTVAVPVSGDSELTFYPIRSFDELSVGRFNIWNLLTEASRQYQTAIRYALFRRFAATAADCGLATAGDTMTDSLRVSPGSRS